MLQEWERMGKFSSIPPPLSMD